jgi:hypothetical protein
MSFQSSANHIYFNVRIEPDALKKREGLFSVNRVQPVLDKTDDYEMAVVRFSLPLTSVPLIVFEDNYFSVSLKIGTNEYTEYLQWVSNSNVDLENRFIYIVQDLLDLINTAYALLFSNLSGANVITSTVPPFMSFSSETNLITLNVPQSFLVDGIDIYANEKLYLKMNSFQDFYNEFVSDGQLNYKFVIQDLFDNNVNYDGIDYYTSIQEFATIGTLSDLQSILFNTTQIPVNRELDGAQKNITSNFLTDFEPTQSNKWYGGGLLQFFPQGPLRYIDLLSKNELKDIDIQIKWKSKKGNIYPYLLQGDQSATIKLLFRKKANLTLVNFIDDRIEDKLEELHIV